MVLIVYGSELSPPVRTVLLTLKALGLEYEFKKVNMEAGEHLSSEYLAKNPQHTIPTLEDDGKLIWDSHAIITYLVDKYGNNDTLYPKDLYLRALVNQRLFFEEGIFNQKVTAAVFPILRGGAKSVPADKIEDIFKTYGFLEKFLSDNFYLVGNNPTVADFSIVTRYSSSAAVVAPVDPLKFPKLKAWYQRIQKLPYYQEANGKFAAIIAERLKGSLE